MSETENKQIVDLNPRDFKLNDYDNVHITMPAKPELSEKDIDDQLLEYVISSGRKITSVDELDDSWVKENFVGLETVDDVRGEIKNQYDKDLQYEYNNIKFQACAEALISRLEGEVDKELLDANAEVVRESNLKRLEAMHISLEQYLREEHLTPDQYDKKVREEALYQMRLNVALDLEGDVLNIQVGNDEITEYLSSPNPEKFLEEIREKNMVEQARRAAARIKTMRRVIDTAIVQEIDEEGIPVVEQEPKVEFDEDIIIPDFENLPKPKIHDNKSGEAAE